MSRKAIFVVSWTAFVVSFCAGLAMAEMIPLYRFRGVSIPVPLKIKDKTLEKGTYDLDFGRNSTPVAYYLRFMKKGKILEVVPSGEWPYGTGIVSDVAKDKSIPTSPTLKMSKNTTDKRWLFIFESGRNNLNYPMLRVKLELPYEE